jgi:hypothetical protein
VFGPGINLAAAGGARRPIWVQAAVEGTWKGHPAHPIIKFTEATFDQVIANFRKNPSFQLGASGTGSQPVIRCDYEHASEVGNPTLGDIPSKGVPAPGWLLDLEKRRGPNGKVQLWALTDMGEQLWGQVERGEYRWTSVSIDPNGKDRASGSPIGAVMTSLAMTNNPFILGMEPMSTSQAKTASSGKIAASASIMLVDDTSRTHVVEAVRDMNEYAGLNEVEQAISMLSHITPSFGLRPWHEQVLMAADFCAGRLKV